MIKVTFDFLTNKAGFLLIDWAIKTYCDVFQQRTTTKTGLNTYDQVKPNTPKLNWFEDLSSKTLIQSLILKQKHII